LEYSAVPIPSCPEALTLAVGKGIISAATAKEFNPDAPGSSATVEMAKESVEPVVEKALDEAVGKPEVTENYIRIPVDKGDHSGHKIRTMSLSDKQGIKGLYCVDDKRIITYLFDCSCAGKSLEP
jgi:hypothetical protein